MRALYTKHSPFGNAALNESNSDVSHRAENAIFENLRHAEQITKHQFLCHLNSFYCLSICGKIYVADAENQLRGVPVPVTTFAERELIPSVPMPVASQPRHRFWDSSDRQRTFNSNNSHIRQSKF